jgi:hypothetical protein
MLAALITVFTPLRHQTTLLYQVAVRLNTWLFLAVVQAVVQRGQ